MVAGKPAGGPMRPAGRIWSGVGKLLLKAIPANVVRDAIVGGGKAILANRQRSADQDQPVPEATKQ